MWPVSKLQAVYLFLRRLRVWGDFLLVYLKFAARILIAHRELCVHITLEQPRLFLYRGSLINTSMSTYHFFFNQVIAFVSVKNRKNHLQWRGTLGMKPTSYRHGYMTSQWIKRRFVFLCNVFDRFEHKEAIMSFFKKMRRKGRSRIHQELPLRTSVPSTTVECAKDKW